MGLKDAAAAALATREANRNTVKARDNEHEGITLANLLFSTLGVTLSSFPPHGRVEYEGVIFILRKRLSDIGTGYDTYLDAKIRLADDEYGQRHTGTMTIHSLADLGELYRQVADYNDGKREAIHDLDIKEAPAPKDY